MRSLGTGSYTGKPLVYGIGGTCFREIRLNASKIASRKEPYEKPVPTRPDPSRPVPTPVGGVVVSQHEAAGHAFIADLLAVLTEHDGGDGWPGTADWLARRIARLLRDLRDADDAEDAWIASRDGGAP